LTLNLKKKQIKLLTILINILMTSNYSPQNDFPDNDDWDYIFKLMILIALLITALAIALIVLTPEIFNYLITLKIN